MANEFKVRKGLIAQGSGSIILDIQGSQGELFSVTDSLSGSLFSVNDISGIPILNVNSNNTVKVGTFNAEGLTVSGSSVKIGIISSNVHTVTGSLRITCSLLMSTSSLFGLPLTSSTAPITGSMFWSSSLLFVYDGTKYMSASFV